MKKLLVLAFVVLLLAPAAAIAAGGQFTDDDDSVFEADIEWLANAGVTLGCNPPTNDNFCPDDEVKRGQMAAFMRRFAAFLGAEDGIVNEADTAATAVSATTADSATTAGDADTVDGYEANELVRVAGTNDSAQVDDWDGSAALTTVTTIEAPTDGFLLITFNANLAQDASETGAGRGESLFHIEVNDVIQGDQDFWSLDFDAPDWEDQTITMQRLVPVTAGTQTVEGVLGGTGLSPARLAFVYDRSLTVLFVPFDGMGDLPTPAAEPARSTERGQE